jgi:hypothetical protein
VAVVLCAQAGPLAQLLAQNEHVWVHWRLAAADTGARGDAEAATAAAMCLERVAVGTPGARPYDGKNWFPFEARVMQLLQSSIPDPAAATAAAAAEGDAPGRWHLSMQYSLPLGLLRAATHKVPSRSSLQHPNATLCREYNLSPVGTSPARPGAEAHAESHPRLTRPWSRGRC